MRRDAIARLWQDHIPNACIECSELAVIGKAKYGVNVDCPEKFN